MQTSPVREPALGIRRAIRAAVEIFAAHPMAAHQKIAERLAVPRQFAALGVDDLHVRAASGAALLQPLADRVFPGQDGASPASANCR